MDMYIHRIDNGRPFFPAIAPTVISAGVVVGSFSQLCRGRTMWPFTVNVEPSLHTEGVYSRREGL